MPLHLWGIVCALCISSDGHMVVNIVLTTWWGVNFSTEIASTQLCFPHRVLLKPASVAGKRKQCDTFSYFHLVSASPARWASDTWWCAAPATPTCWPSASWTSCRRSSWSPTTPNGSAAWCGRTPSLSSVSWMELYSFTSHSGKCILRNANTVPVNSKPSR